MKNLRHRCHLLGIILVFAVASVFSTATPADDCYRYISGDATDPQIDDACVQQLGVPPIFVRTTIDGYDLLIPTSTDNHDAMNHKRFSASIQWLSSGSHLASVEHVVDAMVGNSALGAPYGNSQIEQVNYNLASWLNTSGATTAIANLANNVNSMADPDCWVIPQCTSCQFFVFYNGKWHCHLVGSGCCVIGRRLELDQE